MQKYWGMDVSSVFAPTVRVLGATSNGWGILRRYTELQIVGESIPNPINITDHR